MLVKYESELKRSVDNVSLKLAKMFKNSNTALSVHLPTQIELQCIRALSTASFVIYLRQFLRLLMR